jgi:tetratricopeptide (TPR) repeat protein
MAETDRLKPQAVVVRVGNLRSAPVDTDLVIMNLPNSNYVGLDAIGRRIWSLLEAPRRIDELCRRLADEYDGKPEEITHDVIAFLNELYSENLITVNEALAQYDAAIERFPTDAVGYNGRAETLRALGRLNEALAQYDAAIERFPTDAVGYTGRAETLRALGRLNEALAQYDQTIERFPNQSFARRGRSYVLILKGDLSAARNGLATSNIPSTLDDWVSEHILGMADLHEGKCEAAIAKFSNGAEHCLFAAQKKYFLTALSIARLRKSRDDTIEVEKAEVELERLKPTMMMPEERGIVLLLAAHAAAAKRNRLKAEQLIKEARTVISTQDFARKRLERELVRRFQLFEPVPRVLPTKDVEELEDAVFDAEFQLLAA